MPQKTLLDELNARVDDVDFDEIGLGDLEPINPGETPEGRVPKSMLRLYFAAREAHRESHEAQEHPMADGESGPMTSVDTRKIAQKVARLRRIERYLQDLYDDSVEEFFSLSPDIDFGLREDGQLVTFKRCTVCAGRREQGIFPDILSAVIGGRSPIAEHFPGVIGVRLSGGPDHPRDPLGDFTRY